MAYVNIKCYFILSSIGLHLFLGAEAGHFVFSPEDNDKEVLEKDAQRRNEEGISLKTPQTLPRTTTRTTLTPGPPADETTEDPCAKHPCRNYGLCRPDAKHPNSQFHCLCQAGYVGKTCEKVMLTCDSLKCIRQTECVSSKGGAICICDTGDKSQLCGVNQATSHSQANMEPVLSDPTKHQLVLVFGVTMCVFSLVAVFLCIHCMRASAKSKKLREDYKTKLRAGDIPVEVPPDLLDVSNAMCCCGDMAKLTNDDKHVVNLGGKEVKDSNINAKGVKYMNPNRASNSGSRSPVLIRKPGKLLNRHRQRSYNNSSQAYIEKLFPESTGNATNKRHHRTTDKAVSSQLVYSDSMDPQGCFDSEQKKFSPITNHRSRKLFTRKSNYLNLYRTQTQPFKQIQKNKTTNQKKDNSKYKNSVADKESYQYSVTGIPASTCLDPYTSSSTEEEIYLRPVQRNTLFSKSRLFRNTISEMDRYSEEKGNSNSDFTSDTYHQDTFTCPYSISPDAKKNVCANNSIAANAEIKPLPGYGIEYSVDGHNCGKDITKTATNNKLVFDLENCAPLYDESGADSLHTECTEDISYDTESFLKTRGIAENNTPAFGIYKLPNNCNTDISGLDCLDKTEQESTYTATATSDIQIKPHETDKSTLLQSTKDLQPPKSEDFNDNNINYETGTTENSLHETSADDKYLKSFVKEGSTLVYIPEEPLAGDQANLEDDFEVIPDGKGSLLLISKSEKGSKHSLQSNELIQQDQSMDK